MTDSDIVAIAVGRAIGGLPAIGAADLQDFSSAAGLATVDDDVRLLINHVRAGGPGLASVLTRAIKACPAPLDLLTILLCVAEPVAPVPEIVVAVLGRLQPSHPVAGLLSEFAACFVFDALGVGQDIRFAVPTAGVPSGEVVLLDFDAPLTRWAQGNASLDGETIIVSNLRNSGLDTSRNILCPLVVFSRKSTLHPSLTEAACLGRAERE